MERLSALDNRISGIESPLMFVEQIQPPDVWKIVTTSEVM